ncbi:hypothetical protein SK128_019387, partial [Halocaridina rubra]
QHDKINKTLSLSPHLARQSPLFPAHLHVMLDGHLLDTVQGDHYNMETPFTDFQCNFKHN